MPLMPARDARGDTAKLTPPSVASKWPTKMRESRPQIPACWPRIPHAGKHEMPLKGPSFQPIPSLQPADRRSTPPVPGNRTHHSHSPQVQRLPVLSVTTRSCRQTDSDLYVQILGRPVKSLTARSLLRASNTCSTPSPDRAIPSLSYLDPFLRYSRFTIELQFCDYSAVASASISNPSPPLAITRCCAMLFFACSRTG
jgi:hypothetical protein